MNPWEQDEDDSVFQEDPLNPGQPMQRIELYVSDDPANDPFVQKCCHALKPAHKSNCRANN